MDGLIHISELSWGHVNHPSEVLEIGQEVNVKVLDIDRERQRISLGLKQTQSDPWQQVLDSYSLNDVVDGKVTKVVTFGAFVEILPGVEGLVHISELAQHHVENPREVVAQGQAVQVKIIEMDAERRRLSLSLKRVEESEGGQPRAEDAPPLALSEEVFSEEPAPPLEADEADAEDPEAASVVAEAETEEPAAEAEAEEPAVEADADPPVAEAAAEEPAADAEAEEPRPMSRLKRQSRLTKTSKRPRRVAITGGIGAGKSEALEAFRTQGAAVLSSDDVVHELYAGDREVKSALDERFGTTDRGRIAEVVFGDSAQLEWLEQLLHPRVRERYAAWFDAVDADVAVVEIPFSTRPGRTRCSTRSS